MRSCRRSPHCRTPQQQPRRRSRPRPRGWREHGTSPCFPRAGGSTAIRCGVGRSRIVTLDFAGCHFIAPKNLSHDPRENCAVWENRILIFLSSLDPRRFVARVSCCASMQGVGKWGGVVLSPLWFDPPIASSVLVTTLAPMMLRLGNGPILLPRCCTGPV